MVIPYVQYYSSAEKYKNLLNGNILDYTFLFRFL